MPRVWRARGAQPKVAEIRGVSSGVPKVAPEVKVSFYGTKTKSSFYPAVPHGIVHAPEREVVDETSTAYSSQRSRSGSSMVFVTKRSFYKRPVKGTLKEKRGVDLEVEKSSVKEEAPVVSNCAAVEAENVKNCEVEVKTCKQAVEPIETEDIKEENQPEIQEDLAPIGEAATSALSDWIRLPDQRPWADSLDDSDEESFCGLANWRQTGSMQAVQVTSFVEPTPAWRQRDWGHEHREYADGWGGWGDWGAWGEWGDWGAHGGHGSKQQGRRRRRNRQPKNKEWKQVQRQS